MADGPKNPFDEHTEMWSKDFSFNVRWPWQARLGARLSDLIDRHSNHDRRADAPVWWRTADRLAGWLYTWGQR